MEEKVKRTRPHLSPIDHGYAWVVLFAAVMLNVMSEMAFSGVGVFIVELKRHFDSKKSVIIGIGAILLSIGFLCSFLIGWLVKKFGCRLVGCISSMLVALSYILTSFIQTIPQIYLTYGAMLGITITCYFNISSIVVQQYFERRRAVAQGTLMAGLGIGTFIWPPFLRLLMDVYGWRGAQLICAGIQLHGVAMCALLRPVYTGGGKSSPPPGSDKNKENTDNSLIQDSQHVNDHHDINDVSQSSDIADQVSRKRRNNAAVRCFNALFKTLRIMPHFGLYVISVIFAQSGNVLPYTLLPSLADGYRIGRYKQALLVSILAIVSTVVRILSGAVGDHPRMNRLLMCGVASMLAGAITAITPLFTTFVSLTIVATAIAVPSGTLIACYGSAAVDVVGKKYVQQAIGLMSMGFGLAHLSTFLVTGKLADLTGGISYGFLVFGLVEVVGGITFIICFFMDRRKKLRPP